MRNYILGRLVRSIFSILIVVSIVIVLVYQLIPMNKMFDSDTNLQKYGSKPDELVNYKYQKWEIVGYLDYLPLQEICLLSDDYSECMVPDSEEFLIEKEKLENKGYEFKSNSVGRLYAFHEYNSFELIRNFYSQLIVFDGPNKVIDEGNPDLERKVYVANDFNGRPSVKCSGCEHEYLLYLNGSFPFIHSNWIGLDFGTSYPTFNGLKTLDVISNGQGEVEKVETVFPTGEVANSAANLYSATYKASSTLDRLDTKKFTNNYANVKNNYQSPSMISISYIFGILGLLIAYLIALPAGINMAQNKGKWQDKLGMVYINFMISVPSLAFIFLVKLLGTNFGMPDKFPQLGFSDIRSYILPVIILGLLNTSSLMIWMRRFMVDQSNSDYVKFARAKGLTQTEIFNKHILKNAIIPIVNGIPLSIILAIGGAVITETVFAIPGMGKMLPDSINYHNNSMVICLAFIFTALSVFALLIGDLLITVVDPRISLSTKGDTR
jgi:oligopeptide transport system permease protein